MKVMYSLLFQYTLNINNSVVIKPNQSLHLNEGLKKKNHSLGFY